jgi:hypothetical protein
MRTRLGTTALVALVFAGTTFPTSPLGAQASAEKTDSAHHFALFGGRAAAENRGPESGFELGVSADLRWRPVPVPLRLSLSFSQRTDGTFAASRKGGMASLEAVLRPFPKKFGIQPYFLGGLGVGTRVGYSFWADGTYLGAPYVPQAPLIFVTRPRETWAFASAGAGLDIGRAFIQVRMLNPIASQGPIVVPLNVGFRFWD